ncbi:RNA methyltransferase [Pseudobdellovibrio exovorus]|uniref:Ribosomal RNA large subunit methyltransferase K/L-like methyltransferase domain-containing protein n=1 Tax=Pseudobdellovibrio exovorus JSS TaxID=1184267 RepID=M4V9U1_9BACT|nr:RNA methyltransferase [Pseudobdellovibrio exovorus]AGH95225.1 hypothetical protein A11Q_1009 [Pseudobdellovibrio exovorus JSS]
MSRFFISCPIGFENSLVEELKSFWFEMIDLDGLPTRSSFPELDLIKGGLELECEDHLGYQINLFSKIAGRVLLRVASFESRYFDQFEKQLSKVPLNTFLETGMPVTLQVESHKSRLNNEKSILESASGVLQKMGFNVVDKAKVNIYLRFEKDRATISLDTTGEHLHRRGYAVYRGEAPLRETLAAYLIRRLSALVNLDQDLTIVDPFVGSGTILFEALSCYLPNLHREYSWQIFKKTPKLFKSDSWTKNFRWIRNSGQPLAVGYDIDEKAILNLSRNKDEFCKVFGVTDVPIKAEVKDSQDVQLQRSELTKNVWLVCNPPYGIRLDDQNVREIIQSFEQDVDGMVILHPPIWNFNFSHLKLVSSDDFKNQGLSLKLSIYSKKIN